MKCWWMEGKGKDQTEGKQLNEVKYSKKTLNMDTFKA